MKICVFILILLVADLPSSIADGVRLENFDYPYPVQIFKFTNQKQDLEMAYIVIGFHRK